MVTADQHGKGRGTDVEIVVIVKTCDVALGAKSYNRKLWMR